MVVSIIGKEKLVLENGNVLFRYFAQADNGGIVGNFYNGKDIELGSKITLSIGLDKNCKFVVRPLISSK